MMPLGGAIPTFRCRVAAALLLAPALVVMAGCARKTINGSYGHRRGIDGGTSVNGTGVLADLFEQAGYDVRVWHRMSPRLERSKVLIWAPDDFSPPTAEQREFLEDWLLNEDDRTFIYIGRDYDALPAYWSQVFPQAPAAQAAEVARRRARSIADHDRRCLQMPEKQAARWFLTRRDGKRREVRTLQGPWSEGVDAEQAAIVIEGRLEPMTKADIPKNAKGKLEYDLPASEKVLLASEGDVLVREVSDDWYNSKVIVATNGSFLLNLPLVNHEHRKLAGKLIEACGEPGTATFLESGPLGMQVYNHDADPDGQSGFEWLTVWPMGAILLHILSFGILVCFALFPIFGRPRRLEEPPSGDFGRHIGALGELMELTGDEEYARQRLAYYHQNVKRDSGASSLDRNRRSNARRRPPAENERTQQPGRTS